MIRVFPRRTKWTPTDPLAFVGEPPLFRPPDDRPVRISVVFTWDREEGERLLHAWRRYYSDVEIGGPAFGDPGGIFVPGVFLKPGVTISSRGCPRSCPWCFVPGREGRKIREIPIRDGFDIQDNNLLACSENHVRQVFAMLRRQKERAYFRGGLDARLLRAWHVEELATIKVGEIWLACDSADGIETIASCMELLKPIELPAKRVRSYVMIGFEGETLAEAERRLQAVYRLGALPFSQLYQGEKKRLYSKEWERLNKLWSRPAAFKASMKPAAEPAPTLFDL